MNERIKELAGQAGLFSARPSGTRTRVMLATIPDTAGEIGNPDTQLEKFAELIVRECASVVNSRDDSDTGFWANLIKEHFGVEE